MTFVDRAKSMHARGDVVRASVILAQGLKRDPSDIEAVEWLLHMYVEELPNPGIEPDLLVVLSRQPNGADLLALVQEELADLGAHDKLRAIDKVLEFTPIALSSEAQAPARVAEYEEPEASVGLDYGGEGDPYAGADPYGDASAIVHGEDYGMGYGAGHEGYAEAQPPQRAETSENWDAFDSPFESEHQSEEREPSDLAPEVLDSSVLGTFDTLPEHLRAEYSDELGASEQSTEGRPIWLVAVAAIAIVILIGVYSMARSSGEDVEAPNWEQEGSSE